MLNYQYIFVFVTITFIHYIERKLECFCVIRKSIETIALL